MIARWITIQTDPDSDIQSNYDYDIRRYVAGFANKHGLNWWVEDFWGNELRVGDAYTEVTVILIIFPDQQIYDMFLMNWNYKDLYFKDKPPFPRLWVTD